MIIILKNANACESFSSWRMIDAFHFSLDTKLSLIIDKIILSSHYLLRTYIWGWRDSIKMQTKQWPIPSVRSLINLQTNCHTFTCIITRDRYIYLSRLIIIPNISISTSSISDVNWQLIYTIMVISSQACRN